MNYHNEIEPYAAQWIRNLIAEKLIPAGDVDERSIVDVPGSDLAGYTSCHFFAGFGGWPFALRLAGWPDDRPVWSGSCPCQPGSVAGKRGGFSDPRHLWPAWGRLIAERSPATIFGEQSAAWSDWLRLVRSDLEEMGYAVGAIPMEAASANADHFRDRYWFVADLYEQRSENSNTQRGGEFLRPSGDPKDRDQSLADMQNIGRKRNRNTWRWGNGSTNDCGRGGSSGVTAGATTGGPGGMRNHARDSIPGAEFRQHSPGLLANGDGERSQIEIGKSSDIRAEQPPVAGNDLRSLVYRDDTERRPNCTAGDIDVGTAPGWDESANHFAESDKWGAQWTERQFRDAGFTAAVANIDGCQYIECPDEKWRRLPPPGVRWLGTGIPARVPKLRAIGNAIDTRAAVKFITAYMECRPS